MTYRTITTVLAAAVATGGTFAVGYPTGTDRSTFVRGVKHRIKALTGLYIAPTSITVSLGAATATITYNGATTLPIGTEVFVELDTGSPTFREGPDSGLPPRTGVLYPVFANLGNPIAADADGIITTAAITTGSPVTTMTGALAVSGAVTLDVPRNVVAAWTGTAVMTVTGYDEYGALMVESSASGTSMTGAKAFKRVTSVAVSANVTGATVGTGNVLGLPIRLVGTAHLVRESQDNANPTAGTAVAGLSAGTKSTATTADVRGTYTPNATPNGTIAFAVMLLAADPKDRGNPQFAG